MGAPMRGIAALCLAALVAPALAAEIDPGQPPGLMLLVNGLPGSANEVAAPPTLDIKVRDAALTLNATSLADVARLLGGEINQTGESENAWAWLCYASPDANSGGTTLTWFFAADPAANTLSGIAVEFAPDEFPDACTRLDAPIDLTTGLPGLGAPIGDLDSVYGKATADSGVPGTLAYMFGGAPLGDGLIARTEAKYILGDTHVLAASVMSVIEPQ